MKLQSHTIKAIFNGSSFHSIENYANRKSLLHIFSQQIYIICVLSVDMFLLYISIFVNNSYKHNPV